MQGTKVQKGNRGITLIALVVTIIVLLILAGVSIQMITGQSGILSQARQAKEETTKGQIRDNVRREIMEKMTEKYGEDLTAEELKDILDNYFSDVPGLEGDVWNAENFPTSFPQIHSNDGNYPFNLGELYNGTLSGTQTPPPQGGTPGNPDPETGIFTKNSTIDGNSGSYNNPTIPAGFKPVNPSEDPTIVEATWENVKDTVNKGLVIEDKDKNQFVWVPVPNATIETDETKKIQGTTIDDITAEEAITPMAEREKGKTNYQGVLYDYSSMNDTTKTVKVRTYSASSYREPDTVTNSGYDDTASNFEIINGILTDPTEQARHTVDTFKQTLQEDYDKMIKSVSTYGGFYVARYEMSLTDWKEQAGKKKAQFIKGATSATAETPEDNEENGANKWYGLYAYNKQFATANGHSSVVESSMIWGSQYDAMMNWMARSGINVASSSISGTSKNTTKITGLGNTGEDDSTDVLNNVYDLLGNRYEWTLEANNTYYRTLRGGDCIDGDSPSFRRYIGYFYPTLTYNSYGSRASLYIL